MQFGGMVELTILKWYSFGVVCWAFGTRMTIRCRICGMAALFLLALWTGTMQGRESASDGDI